MYVNPFWVLSWTLEDDRSFDMHEFQRRRNQLALEFQVAPTETLEIGGISCKQDEVLNSIDELLEERRRHFHWLVYRSQRLNAFLMRMPESVWIGSLSAAEHREWSDPRFGEFVNSVFSPEFAHRLAVALKEGNIVSLRRLAGELPPGVSPDDCYAKSCAWVEQMVVNRLREIEHHLDEQSGKAAQTPASIRDLRNQALTAVDATLLNTLPSYYLDQRNMIGELLRRIAWSVRRDAGLECAALPLLERAESLRLDGRAAKSVAEAFEQSRMGARFEPSSEAAFWAAEQPTERCPYCGRAIPANSSECPYCHRIVRETRPILAQGQATAAKKAVPTQQCPWCGSSVPEGQDICPNCGRPVAGPRATVSHQTGARPASESEKVDGVECPYCHAMIPANVFFCPRCGHITQPGPVHGRASSQTATTARPTSAQNVVQGQGRAKTATARASAGQPSRRLRIALQRGPLMALIVVALLIAALVIYGLIVSGVNRPGSIVPDVATPVADVPVTVDETPTATSVPAQQPALPKASPRPANGTVLKRAANFSGGLGTLSIHNGTDADAIVKLVPVRSTGVSVAVYIQSNSTTTVTGIPDGSYEVLFATGRGYYAAKNSFVSGLNCSAFDTNLDYRTTESTYSTWSITLNAVANGNATTSPMSDSSFEDYQ